MYVFFTDLESLKLFIHKVRALSFLFNCSVDLSLCCSYNSRAPSSIPQIFQENRAQYVKRIYKAFKLMKVLHFIFWTMSSPEEVLSNCPRLSVFRYLRDCFFLILDPRSQRAGSYKFGAVIVNVQSVSQSVSELVSQLVNRFSRKRLQGISCIFS